MISQLKAAESRLQRVQTDLFSAQGEVAAGMIVVRRTCHAGLRTCMHALPIIPEVANHLPLCLQEFFISKDLVGVIIGKKGTRIRQIEQDTGVTSINVNGESGQGGAPRRVGCCELNRWCLCVYAGRITISGPDSSSVQRAREMLELFEESFELQPKFAQWLNEKNNSGLLG